MMTSNMNTTSKIEDKLKYGYDLKNEDNLKNKVNQKIKMS